MWKLVEKLLAPKTSRQSSVGYKSPSRGMKWSFAPGSNLFSGLAAKIDSQSEQTMYLPRNLGHSEVLTCQVVDEVNFAPNGITATGIKAFDGVLQSNIVLKTLDLSGNPIGDEGVKFLCGILVTNASIQKLQLNSINTGDHGFTGLAGSLLENNTIGNLHLNNYGGALVANALAKGLEWNKLLWELHLHGHSIGDDGVCSLMSGLSSHKGKIAFLDIGNNSISAKVAFYVTEYFKKSKNLLWLNLYLNDLADEDAERIADALKENDMITTIDLGRSNIRAKGVAEIAQALKDNTVISTMEQKLCLKFSSFMEM
ncbi:hypothetical protein SLA2020_108660 [Shorea laevis]